MSLDFARALSESGVTGLDKWATVTATGDALRRYVSSLRGAGPLDVEAARVAAHLRRLMETRRAVRRPVPAAVEPA